MKTLTLIRHAKSDWGDPRLSDFNRPLNKRGLRDAPAMASYYQKTGAKPDFMVSSPALRAKTTAEFFLKAFSLSSSQLMFEESIYEASMKSLMAIIATLNNNWEHVVMFGHNPGFSYLANELTGEYYDKVTCSISEIKFNVEDWELVSTGMGTLSHFDYPKNHSELD